MLSGFPFFDWKVKPKASVSLSSSLPSENGHEIQKDTFMIFKTCYQLALPFN